MKTPRHFALIPAAGVGARIGADTPKQYLKIAGKTMLRHVVDTFVAVEAVERIFVVVGERDGYVDDALAGVAGNGRVEILRCGGETRHRSVLNGLSAAQAQMTADDWVLVHDAARPGLTPALVSKLMAELNDDETGGLLAMPVVDTLKREDAGGRAGGTVDRKGLWSAQTPQMFRYGLLRRALTEAAQVTDEASAIEALGLQPRLVEGSIRNFKVTLPQDIELAEFFLKAAP